MLEHSGTESVSSSLGHDGRADMETSGAPRGRTPLPPPLRSSGRHTPSGPVIGSAILTGACNHGLHGLSRNESTPTTYTARAAHGLMPDSIVTFEKPPVTEVVLGVTFRSLGLTASHIGHFWATRLKDHFPTPEDRPAYHPSIEQYPSQPRYGEFTFRINEGTPGLRHWFLTTDNSELLQVQPDWFACNWRKVGPDSEYGRWPSRREAFERWFEEFKVYLDYEGLGEIQPKQAEVTYINHIEPGSTWQDFQDLYRVLRPLGDPQTDFLPKPEQTQFQAQYLITDSKDAPLGRLHARAHPALRKSDATPIVVLNLTARGAPPGESVADVLAFHDMAREWIVRGFLDLTTEDAWQEWGKHG